MSTRPNNICRILQTPNILFLKTCKSLENSSARSFDQIELVMAEESGIKAILLGPPACGKGTQVCGPLCYILNLI